MPADLVVGDGQTGIVEQVPCAANPHFVVRLDGAPDNETKSFPRSQLRPMTHEAQDRYRQELGYGRGQVTRVQVLACGGGGHFHGFKSGAHPVWCSQSTVRSGLEFARRSDGDAESLGWWCDGSENPGK